MGMPSARAAVAVGTVLLAVVACSRSDTAPVDQSAPTTQTSAAAPTLEPPPVAAPAAPDFAAVSQLIDDAIAARQLPGAVVVVGHGGKVVFEKAYGVRKLDGDQGLDGSPAPAEPMTTDTIFDMASLTKPLATATAVMQLYEQGMVQLDDPVQNYLPDFNPSNDPQRASVTVRMLLTHFSGEAGEVDIRDSWGLDGASKAEGLHRALTAPLQLDPGEEFRYSDINYVLLGALIEQVTGEAEDVYVQRNVFAPLGMRDTRFLPAAKACGPHEIRGAAIGWAPGAVTECPADTWSTDLLSRIAPTAIDEDGRAEPARNPDLDRLLRGTVHDTTSRRMGGVAGHAGVFSTAQDVSIVCAGPAGSAGGPAERVSADASDFGVDDDSAAARAQRRATPGGKRGRGSPRRIIQRSRDRTCAAWAGTSTRSSPYRGARSFRSAALATRASPERRCGWILARIPMWCCCRIRFTCGGVGRSRSCGVT